MHPGAIKYNFGSKSNYSIIPTIFKNIDIMLAITVKIKLLCLFMK